MKQQKVWGWTEMILDAGTVQAHRITGIAGGYCSRHYHDFKHNLFLLISGKLRIESWNAHGAAVSLDLSPGQACSIAPPIIHRFRVIEPCVAIEIYFATHGTVNPDDITRLDVGGIEQSPAK